MRKLNAEGSATIDMAEAKFLKEKNLPRCVNCGNFIDDCKCVCPYCGETAKCRCCIGIEKASGGG
ncbi:MAG TPA: hypothetical protein VK536_10320 [Candidatus Limnocylindrales bacterium]|nr:hypothetical protein [Candidatus Limnocylindrales bacterium]